MSTSDVALAVPENWDDRFVLSTTPSGKLAELFAIQPTEGRAKELRDILERRAEKLGFESETYLLSTGTG